MKILHTIAFLLLSGSMTAANIYTKTPKGVTVAVKKHYAGQTALVRLQVLGEKIIRVSATAENSFSDPKSLIIVPQNKHVNYSVSEKADTVIVETKALKAKVNGITGEVWFTDSKGNLLLQEKKGGGKIFKPSCFFKMATPNSALLCCGEKLNKSISPTASFFSPSVISIIKRTCSSLYISHALLAI